MNSKKYKVTINNKVIVVSKEALSAAYCGAYSAQWIKQLGHKIGEDFIFHYNWNIKRAKAIVSSLPRYLSALQMIKNAPANVWTEMGE